MHVELWQCDGTGCSFIGTEEEVNEHVLSKATYPDGNFKPAEEIVCWGALQVGSEAWNKYVFDGIHPMTMVGKLITKACTDLGISVKDL
jgi:hypothetical protein